MSLEYDPTPMLEELEEIECPWCGEDLDDCDCE